MPRFSLRTLIVIMLLGGPVLVGGYQLWLYRGDLAGEHATRDGVRRLRGERFDLLRWQHEIRNEDLGLNIEEP
jgi:hypothetical protein